MITVSVSASALYCTVLCFDLITVLPFPPLPDSLLPPSVYLSRFPTHMPHSLKVSDSFPSFQLQHCNVDSAFRIPYSCSCSCSCSCLLLCVRYCSLLANCSQPSPAQPSPVSPQSSLSFQSCFSVPSLIFFIWSWLFEL